MTGDYLLLLMKDIMKNAKKKKNLKYDFSIKKNYFRLKFDQLAR